MQRCLLRFESAIKSEYTKRNYTTQLNKFLKWTKLKDYQALLEAPDRQILEILEDYLFHLKKTISPNSIRTVFSALELFYIMNDKEINFKKLKRMFPERKKKSGFRSWSTEDIQAILRQAVKKRQRALVLFLASTGCRVGVFANLKIKDISQMENNCKSVLFYEGSNEEYFGFLTPEASKALDEYFQERQKDGERLGQESPLFRADYRLGIEKVKPMTPTAFMCQMSRLIIKAQVVRNKIGNRYDVQGDHGVRKWYNSILKSNDSVNSNWAEKLLGHKNGLDGVYLPNDREKAFKEFKKHILNLTIDPSERQRLELEEKTKKISELEAKQKEIESMKQKQQAMDEKMDLMDDKIRELELEKEGNWEENRMDLVKDELRSDEGR